MAPRGATGERLDARGGILRPRLLITRPVLDALTDEELRACVAHELGHSRGWDNLKRLATALPAVALAIAYSPLLVSSLP